jgi:hypothetical protein
MHAKQILRRRALESHIRRIGRSIAYLEKRRNRFSPYRLFLFCLGLALSYWFGWKTIFLAGILLILDSFYFHRVGKIIQRHRMWLSIKKDQIARIDLNWEQLPLPSAHKAESNHPFETDLDLSGPSSLHHLIDTAISREGSLRLLQWLRQTEPKAARIMKNQRIIRELIPLSRFRDKLLLHFHLVSQEQLDGQKLQHWLKLQSPKDPLRRALLISCLLAPINLLLFLGHQLGWIPGFWIVPFALYFLLYFWHSSILKADFDAVILMSDELIKFRSILGYLETYPYQRKSCLWDLCEPFCRRETLPSTHLRRLALLTNAVGLRMNPVMAFLLNLFIPWDFLIARAIHYDKTRYQVLFPLWVEAWSELEALVSLANHAYLHPDNVLPEIISSDPSPDRPVFQGIQLGHPLIPSAKRIGNDFCFQQIGDLTIITGSNMAGKSTFLKTLGINLCLAYSGGAVYARSLHTIVFRLFTCMQIRDSVQDGFSFFYAEVRRLKALLDALGDNHTAPLFFLIDEIFRGTNSREHLIGSRAYIQRLSGQSCVGLISTHDIELGHLDTLLPNVRNSHFRDDLQYGKMVFDYQLHSGICPSTNALTIMRQEGLPIALHPATEGDLTS